MRDASRVSFSCDDRKHAGEGIEGLRTAKGIDITIFLDIFTIVSSTTRTLPDTDRAVALFHALSDSTRLEILEMLRTGERCVCELQDELRAAQSRLSFHLKVLKDAGLVTDRKDGRWAYYSIVPDALAEVHDFTVAMQPKKGAVPGLRVVSCCG